MKFIPNASTATKIGSMGRRGRKVHSLPGNAPMNLGSSGRKMKPYVGQVDPMSSVVNLGVGGPMPTNIQGVSEELFDTQRPG